MSPTFSGTHSPELATTRLLRASNMSACLQHGKDHVAHGWRTCLKCFLICPSCLGFNTVASPWEVSRLLMSMRHRVDLSDVRGEKKHDASTYDRMFFHQGALLTRSKPFMVKDNMEAILVPIQDYPSVSTQYILTSNHLLCLCHDQSAIMIIIILPCPPSAPSFVPLTRSPAQRRGAARRPSPAGGHCSAP